MSDLKKLFDSGMLDARWNTVGNLKGSVQCLTWSPDPSLAWNSSVIEWRETSTVVPLKLCVLPKTFFATAKQLRKVERITEEIKENRKKNILQNLQEIYIFSKDETHKKMDQLVD